MFLASIEKKSLDDNMLSGLRLPDHVPRDHYRIKLIVDLDGHLVGTDWRIDEDAPYFLQKPFQGCPPRKVVREVAPGASPDSVSVRYFRQTALVIVPTKHMSLSLTLPWSRDGKAYCRTRRQDDVLAFDIITYLADRWLTLKTDEYEDHLPHAFNILLDYEPSTEDEAATLDPNPDVVADFARIAVYANERKTFNKALARRPTFLLDNNGDCTRHVAPTVKLILDKTEYVHEAQDVLGKMLAQLPWEFQRWAVLTMRPADFAHHSRRSMRNPLAGVCVGMELCNNDSAPKPSMEDAKALA
ncbi:hypothetical protein K402DRAFT_7377 [Aulographum hederae CBS 113979]|uniref:Uncharacterized protein n=1 Tax=Aulographum hederae CBS 113979 TaxID=1176131 RepID=A0A6G1HHI7_9PEZI|nr:hypothetical protein K402DRAFT_7377 [Aulographum hederae CBS 113979]